MSNQTAQPRDRERRRHPRRMVRTPIIIEVPDLAPIACESIDVSAGGIRVRAQSRIPLGTCDVVVSSDPGERLLFGGVVLEETLDASTGEVIAHIEFLGAPPTSFPTEPSTDAATKLRSIRLGALIAAGVAAVAVLAVGGFLAAARDDGVTAVSAPAEPTPISVRDDSPDSPTATTAVESTVPPVTTTVPSAATTDTAGLDDAAQSAPTTTVTTSPPPSAASPVARSEAADNSVHVTLGSTREDTSVTSTMGPSTGVDPVRVELLVTPDPDGSTLPIAVRVENRSDDTLHFPDGFRATVAALQGGSQTSASVVEAPAIAQLAPGESVTVDAVFDFGAPGEYDLTVDLRCETSS